VLWVSPLAALVLGYLLGSIPFGVVLTRMFGAGNLRAIGSGSIGATNVLRTGRKGLAAATAILDGAKGAVAVLIAEAIQPGLGPMAGLAAFFGHCYPVWLGFKGGKGVATMFAVALALSWQVALVFALVWLSALAVLRYSSVGGMLAAISTPVMAAVLGRIELVVLFVALALMVLWRHRKNIDRLRRREEPKVGRKSATA
jgi:acyl phosphate:glycerol-3-phosphate acyltransferase